MKEESTTWYVLEDGTAAHPTDVSADSQGVLRSKSGVAVAMRGDVPHTTGNPSRYSGKEMQPDKPERVYKTRESKSAK